MRSMDGDRDSEIAAVISDNEYVESVMNGRFYLAAKFAFTLRVVHTLLCVLPLRSVCLKLLILISFVECLLYSLIGIVSYWSS